MSDPEDIIRDAFRGSGIDQVAITPVDDGNGWLVTDVDPSHVKVTPGKALKPAVSVTFSKLEAYQNRMPGQFADLVRLRAKSSAQTLRALVDMRSPEEIPAA